MNTLQRYLTLQIIGGNMKKYKNKAAVIIIIIAVLAAFTGCTMESDYITKLQEQITNDLNPPSAATYTVSYDGNGNDGGSVPVDAKSYNEGNTVTVLGNSEQLIKNTYSFTGWNTDVSGDGTSFSDGSTFYMGSSDITLYARWQKNVFNITFNKNDPAATGTMEVQGIEEGETKPLSACGFHKDGWAFLGWSTSPSGSAEYFDTADYLMGTTDLILYAKWSENIHTLSFNKNDSNATGSMASQDIAEGAFVYLPVCSFSNTGHSFDKWNSTSLGTGTPYAEGAQYQMGNTDSTIYALWSVNNYTITYYGNGSDIGTVPTESSNEYNSATTISSAGTMARQGDSFTGWNTNMTGTGSSYSAGQSIAMPASNLELYAQWEPDFQIGDTGPGTGLIFYDKGSYYDNWRYMEAAPSYSEWHSKYWGAGGTDIIGADGTELGTGVQNTTDIITYLGTGSTYAGQLCYSLTVGGKSDWVLPSREALILMYTNLHSNGLGGFIGIVYTSSTEMNANQICSYNFSGGYGSCYSGKIYDWSVRAIRIF